MAKEKKMSGIKKTAIGIGSTIGTGGILDFALNVLQNLPGGKNGGRVTPKGIGKAKKGFGKAMGKK
jgi:hypothetical protein|tara:strand:+ start:45 stop:242 length:198 start_codon:yes stop_codon:yes gene_type:complete